jgi:8-oxo-dGTP diphosphatase
VVYRGRRGHFEMPVPTVTQVSFGGVTYRENNQTIEVALIQTGPAGRWQLPKGAANENESIEEAALREVREETGIESEIITPIDRIEYWFHSNRRKPHTRYHKYVTFYLMKYREGNVTDHDQEVNEARWVNINEAIGILSFESEKDVLRKACQMIERINSELSNRTTQAFDQKAKHLDPIE